MNPYYVISTFIYLGSGEVDRRSVITLYLRLTHLEVPADSAINKFDLYALITVVP